MMWGCKCGYSNLAHFETCARCGSFKPKPPPEPKKKPSLKDVAG